MIWLAVFACSHQYKTNAYCLSVSDTVSGDRMLNAKAMRTLSIFQLDFLSQIISKPQTMNMFFNNVSEFRVFFLNFHLNYLI